MIVVVAVVVAVSKTLTLKGCTTMTDWKNDRRKVVSHSIDFSRPHSMLYRIVKNAGAMTLKKTTEDENERALVKTTGRTDKVDNDR